VVETTIDNKRFGPWALITGASSGIGREFARQIAAADINVVLVARRESLLKEAGAELTGDFGIEHRVLALDLTEENFIQKLASATDDLDIGLVVSNAGTGNPGKFLSIDRQELETLLRLNTVSHLDIAHHFGQKLAARRKGGLLFVGAMGAMLGNPYMANDAAAKAYVLILGESLHYDFQKLGLNVTVLMPGPTDTPVLTKFGFDAATMPMRPMLVDQCVAEGLAALSANRATCIPGRMNRIMLTLMPRSIVRKMMGSLFEKVVANKSADESGRAATASSQADRTVHND
jgi:hypothetical protein